MNRLWWLLADPTPRRLNHDHSGSNNYDCGRADTGFVYLYTLQGFTQVP